ncbi:ABC transporter substrate-binding protein [Ilumatobacter nonamiensis]|uniref:ABC transporter substrate-binding protein n=1 Tax=Ilumatobacter nonamiensis TaxID=467093 RepID=UPI00034AAE84|nr:ABC transporter substrate-binding protein [Ilumatobacter nonamiensis]
MRKSRAGRRTRLLAGLSAIALVVAACGGSDGDSSVDDGTEEQGSGDTGADEDGDDLANQAAGLDSEDDSETAEDDESEGDESEDAASEDAESGAESNVNADSLIETVNDLRFTGEPEYGGTLTHSWTSDVQTLDPQSSISYNLHTRLGPIFNKLYSWDYGPDVPQFGKTAVPELAAELPEISDDGLTYTIQLRDDVYWQDLPPVNGRQFTADDVVATMEAYRSTFQGAMIERVETIEAIDDFTVQLNLSEQFSPLSNNLANHQFWMLPAEAFDEASGYDPEAPVGTGPFELESHEFDVATTYVRNDNYWKTDDNGNQLPYLDEFRIAVIKDAAARNAAFIAGEIDLLGDAGSSREGYEQLKQDYPDGQYLLALGEGLSRMALSCKVEPFNDPDVRRAISLAIDREGLGENVWGGGAITSPISLAFPDFSLPEEERLEAYRYDLEAAQQLLADAGYPDGFELTVLTTEVYGPAYTAQTEWVVADLEALGIDVTLETLDYGTYIERGNVTLDFEMIVGPQTPFQEPDEWLRGQYHTDGPRNNSTCSDPTLDALIDEQLSLFGDERVAKIQEIQRYVMEDMNTPIPLWTIEYRTAAQPWVRNIAPYGVPNWYGLPAVEVAWRAAE